MQPDDELDEEAIRYFFRIGVDGEEGGPESLRRIAVRLTASQKRAAFIRDKGDDEWVSYTRFLNRRRGPAPQSREWLSDVTRAAIARIVGGALMIVVGLGLSMVTSRIFIGLVIGGLVFIGRAIYRWADGRT